MVSSGRLWRRNSRLPFEGDLRTHSRYCRYRVEQPPARRGLDSLNPAREHGVHKFELRGRNFAEASDIVGTLGAKRIPEIAQDHTLGMSTMSKPALPTAVISETVSSRISARGGGSSFRRSINV